MDRDVDHDHPQEFYEEIKTRQSNEKITVHMVPHTHDDVGWLKTVDQYYTGDRDDIQRAGVQYVLNGVYDQLMKDPEKKFTYVEMAFFERWWHEQTDEVRENVQMLVDQKRLQFVNAGWSMSDEATVHYEDFINNMKAGHDFLKSALGYRPTIGWHIDPFGHHSATAALFAEMGFNAWFFARMDHYDKDKRLEEKSMEWLWRPFNESLGARAEIFTHLMYNHYSPPPGFQFSEFGTDPPIVDNPRLETYNVDERVEALHDFLVHMNEHYRSNHLLIPMGEDFTYLNAQKYFFNLDKLLKHFNAKYGDEMELIYSTPYEYIDAVHEADIEWPTKYDDLFPYSDNDNAYWTGYFTSRANLKGFVREVSSDFNSQSLVLALDYLMKGSDIFQTYKSLFEVLGVLQHHDGVSGTEKQHVADDYAQMLDSAHVGMKNQFAESLKNILDLDYENFSMCQAHNSSSVDCLTKLLDTDTVPGVVVTLANIGNGRKSLVQIPVPHSNVAVFDSSESEVEVDIVCKLEEGRDCTIYFPLETRDYEYVSFFIKRTNSANHLISSAKPGPLKFNGMTMELKDFTSDVELEISRDGKKGQGVLMNYLSYDSFQEDEGQKSGAYIFRPAQPDIEAERFNGFYTYDGFQGKFVSQLRLFGNEVNLTITGNVLTDFVELESKFFGIPLEEQGKEVILHLNFTDIQNNGVFYTDSMGLEMQERKVGFRPTWELNSTQPISENYYPINHGMTIMDDKMTLEVLNDRSQGGSSLDDGCMEFMIERRTYRDDARGVGEAINETNPFSIDGRGIAVDLKHYLRFYNNTVNHTIAENSRSKQRDIDNPLLYVYGTLPVETEFEAKRGSLLNNDTPLPEQVKAVWLPQEDRTLFFRLENILDLISSDEIAVVNVEELAAQKLGFLGIKSITEVSNTGLFTMEEMQQIRYKWKGEDFTTPDIDYANVDLTHVELGPQRIRSLVVEFNFDEVQVSE